MGLEPAWPTSFPLALFGKSQKSSNFFLKSAAVAASASQVRTLKPSRPLWRPPGVGRECRLENSQVISNQACRFWNCFLGPIPELFSAIVVAAFPGNAKNNVDPADPTLFLAKPGMPSLGLS